MLAQGRGRAEDEALHGALAALERLRDLAVRHALDAAQDQRSALIRRQPVQHVAYPSFELPARQGVLALDRVGVRECDLGAVVRLLDRMLERPGREPLLRTPDLVQAGIGRDAVEPRGELGLRLVPRG